MLLFARAYGYTPEQFRAITLADWMTLSAGVVQG